MPTVDIYSIPKYYDILHGPGTASEVEGLFRIQRRFVGDVAQPVWLEPACGSGRYLRAAAKKGVRAIGFDLSEAMVEYAAKEADREGVSAQTEFFVGDMRDFNVKRNVEPVHFAFNTINTIRHIGSDAAMLDHFECMAQALMPGGVYIVGISMVSYGNESPAEDLWKGSRRGVTVSQVINYIPATGRRGHESRTERVISHLTVIEDGHEVHFDSTYGLRSYDREQWETLIGRSKMQIVTTINEQGEDLPVPEIGYILFVLRPREEASLRGRR